MTFVKNSEGKWSVAEGQSSTGTDSANTLPLVEEAVYKSEIKNYHGAGSDSWSGSGLREKSNYYVEKDSTSHTVKYSTVFKGNAVKLVYGEKQASYTFNVYYARRCNGVLGEWELGKTVTKYVDTTPEEEIKRTRYLTYNDTLEGMGVTTVLKPETYLLQDDLTYAKEHIKQEFPVLFTGDFKQSAIDVEDSFSMATEVYGQRNGKCFLCFGRRDTAYAKTKFSSNRGYFLRNSYMG